MLDEAHLITGELHQLASMVAIIGASDGIGERDRGFQCNERSGAVAGKQLDVLPERWPTPAPHVQAPTASSARAESGSAGDHPLLAIERIECSCKPVHID